MNGRGSALAWTGFGAVAVVFMLSPLVLLVVFSFSANAVLTIPITGWTLGWFHAVFETPAFWIALRNSLVVGLVVGLVSTVVGTMAAFAIARVRPARAEWAKAVFSLPVMLPPLVLSLSLLAALTTAGLPLGLHAVILGHLVYTQPFVLFVVHARLVGFDWSTLDSARDLGASPLTAFRTVCLPVIRPTVIGAALITIALSFDDFIITFFTIGGGNTLPTFLWGMLRKGVNPSINVAGLVLVAMILVTCLIALRATRHRG